MKQKFFHLLVPPPPKLSSSPCFPLSEYHFLRTPFFPLLYASPLLFPSLCNTSCPYFFPNGEGNQSTILLPVGPIINWTPALSVFFPLSSVGSTQQRSRNCLWLRITPPCFPGISPWRRVPLLASCLYHSCSVTLSPPAFDSPPLAIRPWSSSLLLFRRFVFWLSP